MFKKLMDNGFWTMDDGQQTMDNRRWKINFSIVHCLSSIVYEIKKSIAAAIRIIDKSSTIVTVDIGKLKPTPKQAHRIFLLFKTLCKTPMILKLITTTVVIFVANG